MTSFRTAAFACVVVSLFAMSTRPIAAQAEATARAAVLAAQVRAAQAEAAARVAALAAQAEAAAQTARGGRGAPTSAGTFDPRTTDPMAGPVVTGAPFSADAITTVTQTLGDGTRIEQRTTAKFYRDGTGRVRREQTIIGLDGLNPSAEAQTVITIDTAPGGGMVYSLDPVARTARLVPRALLSGANLYLSYFRWGAATGVNWRLRVPDQVQVETPVVVQGSRGASARRPGRRASDGGAARDAPD